MQEERDDDPASTVKTVLIFAGPNGSGKSSVTTEFLSDPESPFRGAYINADELAKSLERQIVDPGERNIVAANQAEQMRGDALSRGDSFAFETVMSTPEKVALMTQARVRGYEVDLVFVTTRDPAINVERVADRVMKGGHPVPTDAIRSRYASAMRLLPVAVELADSAVVFDNSKTDQAPIVVAQRMSRGRIEVASGPDVPSWVDKYLVTAYGERVKSLAALTAVLRSAGFKDPPPVDYAEAAHGKSYAGKIVGATDHHVLQEAGDGRFLVHARALTQDRTYRVGEVMSVSYGYDRGKIAQRSDDRGDEQSR